MRKVRTRRIPLLCLPLLLAAVSACDIVTADFKAQESSEWSKSYELQAGRFSPGPHAITVRAVDALGRWGGASTVMDVESEDVTPAAPRHMDRPEVR